MSADITYTIFAGNDVVFAGSRKDVLKIYDVLVKFAKMYVPDLPISITSNPALFV